MSGSHGVALARSQLSKRAQYRRAPCLMTSPPNLQPWQSTLDRE
jgi:hypothetical protein